MSKKEFLFLSGLVCFCSCSNPLSEEEEKISKTFPVQFSVQLNKAILPYADTRSIPNESVPEPGTSEGDIITPQTGDIENTCSCIDYFVYNTENPNTPVKHRQYKSNDPDIDFGIVYDTLPQGNYEIRLLAHSSVTEEPVANILTFDKVTDSFYKQIQLTIGSGEQIIQDVSLQRIIGRVEFMATDIVHSNLKQFDIELSNYPNRLNILTGKGIPSSSPVFINHTFTTDEIGKENNSHSLLTFIPDVSETIGIKLTATDLLDKLIRNYSIPTITPQVNKTVRYSGKLYAPRLSNDTFTLYLENIIWGETITVPLEN